MRARLLLIGIAVPLLLMAVLAVLPASASPTARTSPAIFAKIKARPSPIGKTVTASGTFTAFQFTFGPTTSAKLLDKGTVSTTYTLVGKPPIVVVRGTLTATGKGGSMTWQFSAPNDPVAPPVDPKQGPAGVVGTGKALITAATGDLAQLKGKKGLTAFYFNTVTGMLLVSALL